MEGFKLTRDDCEHIRSLGISEEQLRGQIETLRRSSACMPLDRPCTLGDGIEKIGAEQAEPYIHRQQEAAAAGRYLKFVPASGAATRMFKSLFAVYQSSSRPPTREALSRKAEARDSGAREVVDFVNGLERFAFFAELEEAMAGDGLHLKKLIGEGRYGEIFDYLLSDKGLEYGSLPKGFLLFHRYPTGSRTPFEEHLVEAVDYIQNKNRVCRLHFTVAPDHERRFRQLLIDKAPIYEKRFGVRFEVDFSSQKISTNTIAVDPNNRPFRDSEGRLLFRPGGHGALLDNLNELGADLVYIKNIDNVVPEHLKDETVFWKKVLGGYLVEIQEAVHGYLRALEGYASQDLLDEAARFCREKLSVQLPAAFEQWSSDERRALIHRTLNRPIRVGGMVRNVSEPGGGPFWVKGEDGSLSIQIVESAQVDFTDPGQEAIWNSATHFNPVDLVCGLRDHRGRPFDLRNYVDPEAVFISRKSQNGRELKALELPGLWNGAMSDWISVFVEVPIATFNPVKTVNDLLRAEHQPPAEN